MNRKMLGVLTILGVSMLLVAGGTGAQEFSADMVSREGRKTTNAKISAAAQKFRMETPESVIIVRRDKGLTWILMPADKMYMEQPVKMSASSNASKNFDNEIERVAMGTEDVDGQPAQKFQVTYVEKGKNVSVYQWLRGGQIPVKVEAVDGSWSTEYKNLTAGPQAADLFEPPADYQKFTMPGLGNMMKGLGGF